MLPLLAEVLAIGVALYSKVLEKEREELLAEVPLGEQAALLARVLAKVGAALTSEVFPEAAAAIPSDELAGAGLVLSNNTCEISSRRGSMQ